jgi:hypothetical protein
MSTECPTTVARRTALFVYPPLSPLQVQYSRRPDQIHYPHVQLLHLQLNDRFPRPSEANKYVRKSFKVDSSLALGLAFHYPFHPVHHPRHLPFVLPCAGRSPMEGSQHAKHLDPASFHPRYGHVSKCLVLVQPVKEERDGRQANFDCMISRPIKCASQLLIVPPQQIHPPQMRNFTSSTRVKFLSASAL